MHNEVLNEKTKILFEKFRFLKDDFYLAGGTALALQIGHRISIDLDFFSDHPIKKTLLKNIESRVGIVDSILVNNQSELTIYIDNVKVTFLHYPFIHKYEFVKTDVVFLASIKEIASMKAYALGRRTSLKDYVDLYFIISNNNDISLTSIISDSIDIYKDAFNDRLFCEQLLSIEEFENESIIWISKEVSKEKMKEFFLDLLLKERDRIMEKS